MPDRIISINVAPAERITGRSEAIPDTRVDITEAPEDAIDGSPEAIACMIIITSDRPVCKTSGSIWIAPFKSSPTAVIPAESNDGSADTIPVMIITIRSSPN